VPNLDQAAGLQAAVWTEQIHTPERLWFMIFPRLTALAESAWTSASRKDYADFSRRLPAHFAYLNQRGINSYNLLNPQSTPEVLGPAKSVRIDDGWGKTKSGKSK
jgi:hexosaminidase